MTSPCINNLKHKLSEWKKLQKNSRLFFAKQVVLKVGDKGANITNPYNEEGNGLEKEEYEEAVLPKGKVIAPTEEEIGPNSKL